ncbi:hypothetical protein XENORESO_014182 [Xenotaenia resolanae]|uniref:Uncharacterized protein n=1 Tax=Xenotaenia resolanae TaxID=208358 RepID=A0ABV0W8L5_9TELE
MITRRISCGGLRLLSHCRQMQPMSNFFMAVRTAQFQSFQLQNNLNCATFICGSKLDLQSVCSLNADVRLSSKPPSAATDTLASLVQRISDLQIHEIILVISGWDCLRCQHDF